MVASAKDWTTLQGICFSFQHHSSKQYNDAARVINNAYSNEFTNEEFKSLFTNDKQTALKTYTFILLKDLIKKSLTDDATKTKPSYRTILITKLVDSAAFTYSRHNSDIKCKLRTLDNFTNLLDQSSLTLMNCTLIMTSYQGILNKSPSTIYLLLHLVALALLNAEDFELQPLSYNQPWFTLIAPNFLSMYMQESKRIDQMNS